MSLTQEILSQLPGDVLGGLHRADSILTSIKEGNAPVPTVVKESQQSLGNLDWDVIISGGTLGILIGCALVSKGVQVALIEKGILQGREQEWNISRNELQVLLELDLLTSEEIESAIVTEYNPARVSFASGTEVWVENVLNIGVYPVYLLETLKQRFLSRGGKLFENTPFTEVVVHPDGVMVNNQFKSRLLIDAMGNFSPITQQIRQGVKPDALCMVVGTCASGFPENKTGDLLLSFTEIKNSVSIFGKLFQQKTVEQLICLPIWMQILLESV